MNVGDTVVQKLLDENGEIENSIVSNMWDLNLKVFDIQGGVYHCCETHLDGFSVNTRVYKFNVSDKRRVDGNAIIVKSDTK